MKIFSRDDIKEAPTDQLPARLAAAELNLNTVREKKGNSKEFWQMVEQCVQIRQEITIRSIKPKKAANSS